MSTPTVSAAAAGTLNSSAFLKAVSQLGQRRRVVTSKAIFNHQGIKLLEGGVKVDEKLYDRLVAHRLNVSLGESVDCDAPVTGQMLREASEETMSRMPFFAAMGPPGRMRSILLQAIEAIALPPPVAFHLTLARETRPGMFEHAIMMALLCAHLVREGGAPIHDMTVAATAGLLHDLGMLHIDPELLEAGTRLSGDERRPIDAHPMTSSMLIARFHEYSRSIPRAILEHHELLDGTGYPRGLAGDAISPLGRLLSLAEVVTAMFDGGRKFPEQRVSLLLRVSPDRYDSSLVPSIHRLLQALPVSDADVDETVTELVDRLRSLADLMTRWRGVADESAPALDATGQAVLTTVSGEVEALQRMFAGAGVTAGQLDMLAQSDSPDAAFRAELWTLSRELQWHLRSTAHQFNRRWRAGAGAQAIPPAVSAWTDAVGASELAV